jgi:hypothetical protein
MKWTAPAAPASRYGRHVADVASRRPHEVTDRPRAFGEAVQVAHAAEYAAIRMGRNGRTAATHRIEVSHGGAGPFNAATGGPTLDESGHSSGTACHFENNMNRLTSKAVFHFAAVLILLGAVMVLVMLTSPSVISMETATLLIGVLMIAIASFAGL